ncbi:MAG TPA: hypothetical protein VIS99_06755 [Terrimicrobiaceae bacterium]
MKVNTAAKNDIPIVFVHNGPSQVIVAACVAQAIAAGCKRIFVISDRNGPWRLFPQVTLFPFDHAEDFGAKQFREIFCNYSNYSETYAAIIFEKFFALRALFSRHSLHRILYLDSDLLLFKSGAEMASIYECDFCGTDLAIDNHETVSPHFMFLTPTVCERICSDLMETYGSKEGHERLKQLWKQKKEVHPDWGVCEMDFLGFVRDSGDFTFVRVNQGNPRVDATIQELEGFVGSDGMKSILFENGMPYGKLEESGEKVFFYAIHLQGFVKHLVIHYAQLNKFSKKLLYGLFALERRGLLRWPKASCR